jgi:zinc protease
LSALARYKRSPRLKRAVVLLVSALSAVALAVDFSAFPQSRPRSSDPEAWRKVPPKPGPARPLRLPVLREVALDNGLALVLVEDHRAPVVTILAGIPLQLEQSGNLESLMNQAALREAAGELLTEGAGSRTSERLAREVETLGGLISSLSHDDYVEVSASVVSENVDRMMELFADVVLRPTFPEDEVSLHKRNRIQNLVVRRQDPAFLSGEQFDRVVFGSHPYAITSPSPAAVEALDRAKIEEFYRSHFSPKGSVVVIVGDFDQHKTEEKSRALFGGWKASGQERGPENTEFEFPRFDRRRVYLIDRPGSEQADFRIGGLAVTRRDPDFFPLLVTNAILGAGTNSRLFLNIRERKGFAYDVYTSLNPLRHAGTFFGGAESRPEVTASAIKEMLAEFERIQNTKVESRELEGAKNYLNGLFSISLSTQGGVARRIAETHLFNLGRGYLENYRARIDAVTAEQIQQAARKHLRGDRFTVVIVGDASKLSKQLAPIGPVEVLDTGGRSVN